HVCRSIAEDARAAAPRFDALVLTGGTGRSFSVGHSEKDRNGDWDEPRGRKRLGEIVDLYVAVLTLDIPVVAAIDRFAIGQGLQVALLSDWRIGSARCRVQMPELKIGMGAPFGSVILEVLLGRARMLELTFNYDFLDATTSRALALLNQV